MIEFCGLEWDDARADEPGSRRVPARAL